MNEKDKLAWERACDALYGFGYSEQFSMALWQAALEYARQPAQAEPVAKAVMGKREVSCHGPNRKYVEGVVIQQLKEIEPETLLYTHPAPPVSQYHCPETETLCSKCESHCEAAQPVQPAAAINEQLLQTVKHILGWRELRNGNEFPVRRIEEMCEAAIAAAEAAKKGGV